MFIILSQKHSDTIAQNCIPWVRAISDFFLLNFKPLYLKRFSIKKFVLMLNFIFLWKRILARFVFCDSYCRIQATDNQSGHVMRTRFFKTFSWTVQWYWKRWKPLMKKITCTFKRVKSGIFQINNKFYE